MRERESPRQRASGESSAAAAVATTSSSTMPSTSGRKRSASSTVAVVGLEPFQHRLKNSDKVRALCLVFARARLSVACRV